jgi:hypothetical protein
MNELKQAIRYHRSVGCNSFSYYERLTPMVKAYLMRINCTLSKRRMVSNGFTDSKYYRITIW